MGETHEIPHHNLADFEPCLGYAIEGGEDYAFANLEKLFLPKHGHSQVQGAGLWQVQGDYLSQEPSKDVLSEDGGMHKR